MGVRQRGSERRRSPAGVCCGAAATLRVEADVVGVRRRQVHDLPEIPAPVVTEYRADIKCCPGVLGRGGG